MEKVLLLSAPLKEVIWGGNYFKNELKATDSNAKIGEMWTCSAHPSFLSYIINDTYKGMTLDEVYKQHKDLFNNSSLDNFPILVKIIATSDRLSVQVHPDDEYAIKNENQYGKTEGWLILDCKENSNIVLGHNAKNKIELIEYINNDNYDELLNKTNVKPGDFYPINPGTIHAIGADIVLLEIQQSSDVTYRFYDYHRKDELGNERKLHVKQAIEVTKYDSYNHDITNCFNDDINTLWDNEYFKVYYQLVNGEYLLNNENKYCVVTVIDGCINVEENIVTKGQSFIVTSISKSIVLKGKSKIVITYSKK